MPRTCCVNQLLRHFTENRGHLIGLLQRLRDITRSVPTYLREPMRNQWHPLVVNVAATPPPPPPPPPRTLCPNAEFGSPVQYSGSSDVQPCLSLHESSNRHGVMDLDTRRLLLQGRPSFMGIQTRIGSSIPSKPDLRAAGPASSRCQQVNAIER